MNENPEIEKERLAQNIVALIGEIGEKQVLLRLAILTYGTGWQVFRNLGEAGYDILLHNADTGERRRIEVKTRQRLYTTGKPQRNVHFRMSDGEYQACDCVVAYFMDVNGFFILPKDVFTPYMVKNKRHWRISLSLVSKGKGQQNGVEFLYAWRKIHPDLNPEKMAYEYKMQQYLRKALEGEL